MTTTAKLVRLEEVTFHPHNVRKDYGDLRPLAASIKRYGLLQPIVVERFAGAYRLRAGHRRVLAARLAGLTFVPAIVHSEALELEDWIRNSVQENEHRANLDKNERRRAVQALLDLGCSTEGVAECFGVAVSTINSWMRPDRPPSPKKPSNAKLSKRALAERINHWRASGASSEEILAGLQEYIGTPDHTHLRTPEVRQKALTAMRERREAKVKAVEDLVEAGCSVHAIAQELETTIPALARFLSREGRHDLGRPFYIQAKAQAGLQGAA